MFGLLGLWVAGLTLPLTVFVCWLYGHLPYFPIHISKTANRDPEQLVFWTGLMLSAVLMLPGFLQSGMYAASIATILVPWVAMISDATNIVLHTLIAAASMGLFTLQIAWKTDCGPLAMTTGICQLATSALLAPVLHLHRDHVPTLALRLAEPFFVFPPAQVLEINRLRGLLQWTTLALLGWGIRVYLL